MEQYNDKKLIQALEQELQKGKADWCNCLRLMENLGRLLCAQSKEAMVVRTYEDLFRIAEKIFSYGEKTLVALRFTVVRILTNAVLTLSGPNSAAARTSYNLIIQQIEQEVDRPKPSATYIITLVDALFQVGKAKLCPDDKAAVNALLKFRRFTTPDVLGKCGKDSLAQALNFFFDAKTDRNVVTTYNFGAKAREMNEILRNLGAKVQLSESYRGAYNVPKPQIVTNEETRIKTNALLLQLSPEQVADLVIRGFDRFRRPDGYIVPDSASDILNRLVEGEDDADEEVDATETVVYMVTDALDKLQQRTKFTPAAMQAAFIAMLINTLDSTREGFMEAKGPATASAIQRAVDVDKPLIPFLCSWADYEFARNPKERYYNILCSICEALVSQEVVEGDNSVKDFMKNLVAVPEEMFTRLCQLCESYPEQCPNVLAATNEYLLKAPASYEMFLKPLLGICVNENDIINESAVECLLTEFYARETQFKTVIDQFAGDQLRIIVDNPADGRIIPRFKLFFRIMEKNTELFLICMEKWGAATQEIRDEIKSGLDRVIPKMLFEKAVVKMALDVATKENSHDLMHIYLDKLGMSLDKFPTDLIDMLKVQSDEQNDPRYLVPIVTYLTVEEFSKYLPSILGLEKDDMTRAVNHIISAQKPVTPQQFLVQLHEIKSKDPLFESAVCAMRVSLIHDNFTYKMAGTAVEFIIRHNTIDMFIETLLVMAGLEKFKDKHKYIAQTLARLHLKKICKNEGQWNLMRQLLDKVKPSSFKVLVGHVPSEQILDYVRTYPDQKDMVLNQAKHDKKKSVVELLEGSQE